VPGSILLPITPTTVLVLAALMRRLWLAAVPLTAGLVAQSYGLRDMGTLDRIVFFGHRLGGFMMPLAPVPACGGSGSASPGFQHWCSCRSTNGAGQRRRNRPET